MGPQKPQQSSGDPPGSSPKIPIPVSGVPVGNFVGKGTGADFLGSPESRQIWPAQFQNSG